MEATSQTEVSLISRAAENGATHATIAEADGRLITADNFKITAVVASKLRPFYSNYDKYSR